MILNRSVTEPEHWETSRSRAVGTAIVLMANRRVGTFLLEHVSADSALLVGNSFLIEGDDVRVQLQVHGSRSIFVHGKVTRLEERNGQRVFAVNFQAPRSVQKILQRAAYRLPESNAITLVAEDNREVCKTLTCDLKVLGFHAVGVQTPIHAMGWLNAPDVAVETIAVGVKLGDMNGTDLLEFVAADFPSIRRVLICGNAELRCRVDLSHAVLTRPWTRRALANVFARGGPT
jgi:hypothetical protein